MTTSIIVGVFTILSVLIPAVIAVGIGPRRHLALIKAELEVLNIIPEDFPRRALFMETVENNVLSYVETRDQHFAAYRRYVKWRIVAIVSYVTTGILSVASFLLVDPDKEPGSLAWALGVLLVFSAVVLTVSGIKYLRIRFQMKRAGRIHRTHKST